MPARRPVLRAAWMLCAALALAGSAHAQGPHDEPAFVKGADVSFLPALEAAGVRLEAGKGPQDPLQIYREAGFNLMRVRLWAGAPADARPGPSRLAEVSALGQRIRAAGLRFLLDFHYSDTWADPAHQTPPEAWAGLDFDALTARLRHDTADVLRALDRAGARPHMVQLGNEIGGGMLWPHGRLDGRPDAWTRLGTLLRAARAGVDDAYGPQAGVSVMLHVENGADTAFVTHFFDGIAREGVRYDLIGLSFYSFWGGAAAFDTLHRRLEGYAQRFGKPVLIVETAYPWTLDWRGTAHNAVGTREGLLPEFPPTPLGQARYLEALTARLQQAATPGMKGWVYWAPDWVGTPDVLQSGWENMTLFDFEHRALPALFVRPGPGQPTPPRRTARRPPAERRRTRQDAAPGQARRASAAASWVGAGLTACAATCW